MHTLPLPTYLQLEPVGQCNLRCQMCPIQFRRDGPPHGPLAFMPFEDFARIVDEFAALDHLHLQGLGEPMMHPLFFDMVDYAAGKGIRVTTNSNLTLLNRQRAERCAASGLDTLFVSIDGATRATYERIRVRSRFDRVLCNLEALRAARDRAERHMPHLRLVTVVMRQNLHELPDLVRLAAGWGMEGMSVQHLCHDFGEATLPAHYRPMRASPPRPWAWSCGCRARRRASTRPARPAASAATGRGRARTSATRATQCPAAWSPRPTACTSAAPSSKARPSSGTATLTMPSVSASTPTTRPLSAAPAPCTTARSNRPPREL